MIPWGNDADMHSLLSITNTKSENKIRGGAILESDASVTQEMKIKKEIECRQRQR